MENETKVLPNVETALVHLRDGDLLVCTVPADVGVEQLLSVRETLRKTVEITGKKNVAVLCVTDDVKVDKLTSDKRVAALETELAELKATVAKYVTK